MWTIFKIDKKKIKFLKEDFKKLLGEDVTFYTPKILVEKYKNDKLFSKEYSLLGDYIFCFHAKFNSISTLNILKFSRGLKYFLNGSISSQNEIKNFISRCKNFEDQNGNLMPEFFNIKFDTKYIFKSGPMTERLFSIIEIQKHKLKIILGGLKTTINKKDYLFYPV